MYRTDRQNTQSLSASCKQCIKTGTSSDYFKLLLFVLPIITAGYNRRKEFDRGKSPKKLHHTLMLKKYGRLTQCLVFCTASNNSKNVDEILSDKKPCQLTKHNVSETISTSIIIGMFKILSVA